MASDKPSAFWSTVGKLGALFTILYFASQLWHLWHEPRAHLTATVYAVPFELPPSLQQRIDHLRGELTTPKIADILTRTLNSTIVDNKSHLGTAHIRYAAHAISTRLLPDLHLPESQYSCQINVIVKNNGDNACDDVIVQIPNIQVGYLVKPEHRAQVLNHTDLISIGQISPHESVHVVCWRDIPPNLTDASDIILRYRDGVGVVTMLSPVTGTRYSIFNIGWGSIPLAFAVVFIIVLISQVLSIILTTTRTVPHRNDTSKPVVGSDDQLPPWAAP